MANRLKGESSLYLQQHANNPVHWYPWGNEAIKKAQEENKPILVSIGYSACHWCHVMEHECFEKENVAAVMNKHFVNIKIDREERPDLDAIYMDAVQAMGIGGGWPLNVFLTPDQKPFYGGTYFPEDRWIKVLQQINHVFHNQQEKVRQSAEDLTQHLKKRILTSLAETDSFKLDANALKTSFDLSKGGLNRAPKFPMPSIYRLLINYGYVHDKGALDHALFTLKKMARGGIYDQLEGGFSRYSVDEDWFAPHFEKMLYDNGQLLGLYADAYKIEPSQEFKTVVIETVNWLENEMLDESGLFYSAMDADSEGIEGKYYTWSWDELLNTIPETDLELFSRFYNTTKNGNWEDGRNILHRSNSLKTFAEANAIEPTDFDKKVASWKLALNKVRSERIKPGTDKKSLLSWNALTITGLCKAFDAFEDGKFLSLALNCAQTIEAKLKTENGSYFRHYQSQEVKTYAFLDDLSALCEAYLSLYKSTLDFSWLSLAKQIADYVLANFQDADSEFFVYRNLSEGERLIVEKVEIFDNVMDSGNSAMAKNLYTLGRYYSNAQLLDKSEAMLNAVLNILNENMSYLSNWADLYTYQITNPCEIIAINPSKEDLSLIRKKHLPNLILIEKNESSSQLELTEGKEAFKDATSYYLCKNKSCLAPSNSITETLQNI